MYKFRLYIIDADKEADTVNSVRSILKNGLTEPHTLEVIDILEGHGLENEDEILVTPTLIKLTPPPVKRVVGDFNNSEDVLSALGLTKG